MVTDKKKSAAQLKIGDFELHPVWTWEDDDDMVMPVPDGQVLPDEYDAVFVKSSLTLADGTELNGVVCVRMSNREVYLISLPDTDGKLIDIPLQPLLVEQKALQLRKLCAELRKQLTSIFPLEFKTSFRFADGSQLRGRINVA